MGKPFKFWIHTKWKNRFFVFWMLHDTFATNYRESFESCKKKTKNTSFSETKILRIMLFKIINKSMVKYKKGKIIVEPY